MTETPVRSAVLHRRLQAAKARLLVRRWQARQVRSAHGVWDRLRRTLCDAAQAWVLPESAAARLEADGLRPLPVGFELEPPRRIFFVTRAQLAALDNAREVPVRLSAELLAARALALVSFEEVRPSREAHARSSGTP
jgi:hypothetical protein